MNCGSKSPYTYQGKHGYYRGAPPIVGFLMFAVVITLLVKASWVLLPIGILLFGGMLSKSRSWSYRGDLPERDERVEDYVRKRKYDDAYEDDPPKRKNDEDDIFYV
ncbi:MAG TPA: hypothetical protein PKX07_09080 [Aggregatilineales bacterium]|jgi:hypothetical protein|nr:hypothetical protein [Aggregatilineales bacterium]